MALKTKCGAQLRGPGRGTYLGLVRFQKTAYRSDTTLDAGSWPYTHIRTKRNSSRRRDISTCGIAASRVKGVPPPGGVVAPGRAVKVTRRSSPVSVAQRTCRRSVHYTEPARYRGSAGEAVWGVLRGPLRDRCCCSPRQENRTLYLLEIADVRK